MTAHSNHNHRPSGNQGPPDDPSGDRAPGLELEEGARISATVLELRGEGRVLVGLRGVRIEAGSRVPLVPGRSYTFTVIGSGDRVQLALADPVRTGSGNRAALLASLVARGGCSAMGLKLRELGRALAGGPEGDGNLAGLLAELGRWPDRPERVRVLVEGLGLDYESRLFRAVQGGEAPPPGTGASLKGRLLAALARRADGGDAVERIKALLATLEGLQGENLQLRPGRLLCPIPQVPGVGGGELHLFAPLAAGEPWRVVLSLDLERLGPLRVDLDCKGDHLRLLILTPSARVAQQLSGAIPRLREGLAGSGLVPGALEVRRVREDELSPPGPDLTGGGLVDVRG